MFLFFAQCALGNGLEIVLATYFTMKKNRTFLPTAVENCSAIPAAAKGACPKVKNQHISTLEHDTAAAFSRRGRVADYLTTPLFLSDTNLITEHQSCISKSQKNLFNLLC